MSDNAKDPSAPKPGDELDSGYSFFGEFMEFLGENKIWWITPTVLILLLVVGFIIMTAVSGEGVAPFIYTLF
jgi:hypothetical protein